MRKKLITSFLVIAALLAGFIVIGSAVFTVHPNEAAIVVRLGKAKATVTDTGRRNERTSHIWHNSYRWCRSLPSLYTQEYIWG